jgi:hypothetical protein
MIAVYDDTWQFFLRRSDQYTARRADYVPYCINKSLYDFLNSADDKILDIGCGENNLKLFWPTKIHGVDRTLEADTYAHVADDEFTSLPKFKYGVAVNSLHFGDIERNITLALTKCQKIWISLNNNQDISRFEDATFWNQFGKVEYFWCGLHSNTPEKIKAYLENDMSYSWRVQNRNGNIDEDVQYICKHTVFHDPYYGVIRAVISNE